MPLDTVNVPSDAMVLFSPQWMIVECFLPFNKSSWFISDTFHVVVSYGDVLAFLFLSCQLSHRQTGRAYASFFFTFFSHVEQSYLLFDFNSKILSQKSKKVI